MKDEHKERPMLKKFAIIKIYQNCTDIQIVLISCESCFRLSITFSFRIMYVDITSDKVKHEAVSLHQSVIVWLGYHRLRTNLYPKVEVIYGPVLIESC